MLIERIGAFAILLCICRGSQYAPCVSWQNSHYVGNGICSKLIIEKMVPFGAAQDICDQDGAILMELRTNRQRHWAVKTAVEFVPALSAFYDTRAWLGAIAKGRHSGYFWASNTDLVEAPDDWWSASARDNDGLCLTLLPSGELDSLDCDGFTDNIMCQRYIENPCDAFLPGSDYFDSACYLPVKENKNIYQAQSYCDVHDAMLVEPDTQEEWTFFETFVSDHFELGQQDTVLTGAVRRFTSPYWLWKSTGEPIESDYFLENVTAILALNNLNTNNFASTSEIVVRRAGKDTSGEITWSWHTVNEYSTNYFVCVKDLSEECEGVFAQGSCFTLYPEMKKWAEAKALCEEKGAFLAEPKTQVLSAALDEYLLSETSGAFDCVMLGGSYNEFARQFFWSHSADMLFFTNWLTGAPATDADANHYMCWLQGGWRAISSGTVGKYVCQMEMSVTPHGYSAYLPVAANQVDDVQLTATMQDVTGSTQFAHLKVTSSLQDTAFKLNAYPNRGITFSPYSGSLDVNSIDASEAVWVQVNASSPIDLVVMVFQSSTARSALIYPLNWPAPSSYFLNTFPSSFDICVMSTLESALSVSVDVALYGMDSMVDLAVDNIYMKSRSYTRLTTSIPEKHDFVFITNLSGLTKAPFVSSGSSINVFVRDRETVGATRYDLFDQILPTSLVGSEYIVFPSLPMSDDEDTFTAVAVYNDTVISANGRVVVLYSNDPGITQTIHLAAPGDTYEFSLPALGYTHVMGTKPFYLYARLQNHVGQLSACSLTLLPQNLWRSSFSFQMSSKWTNMNVYAVIIAREDYIDFIDGLDLSIAECHNVDGTDYSGCHVLLSQEERTHVFKFAAPVQSTMAAYLFAYSYKRRACHPMGVNSLSNVNASQLASQSIDVQAYLNYLERASQCPPEVTANATACPVPATADPPAQTTAPGGDPDTTTSAARDTTATARDTTAGQTTQEETTQESSAAGGGGGGGGPVSLLTTPGWGGGGEQTTVYETSELTSTDQWTQGSQSTGDPTGLSTQEAQQDTTVSSTSTAGTSTPETVSTGSGCVVQVNNNDISYTTLNLSAEELQSRLDATSAELRVDRRVTSTFRRGRESAPDSRVSSVCCGLFSIAFITGALAFVIFSDVHVLLSHRCGLGFFCQPDN